MDMLVQNKKLELGIFLLQFFVIVGSLLILLLLKDRAFADAGIIEAGNDLSGNLSNIANIIKTLQIVAYHWIAPGIGGCLVIYGFYKIALVRESMAGTIAIIAGSSMFFIQKIIESLAKLGGN